MLGGPQGRSGQVRKISPPPGFDPRTVQSVGSRYTDYATRPTTLLKGAHINEKYEYRGFILRGVCGGQRGNMARILRVILCLPDSNTYQFKWSATTNDTAVKWTRQTDGQSKTTRTNMLQTLGQNLRKQSWFPNCIHGYFNSQVNLTCLYFPVGLSSLPNYIN
jgi:hypothetical protein